jgi:hypothetical protein
MTFHVISKSEELRNLATIRKIDAEEGQSWREQIQMDENIFIAKKIVEKMVHCRGDQSDSELVVHRIHRESFRRVIVELGGFAHHSQILLESSRIQIRIAQEIRV